MLAELVDKYLERHRELDTRLNPIIPLIDSFYETFVYGYEIELAKKKIKHLGNILLAHSRNLNSTISIGDFIPMGQEVKVKKGQYWSFEVETTDPQGALTKFEIQKTDVWDDGEIFLNINMYKEEVFCLQIGLQNEFGKAHLIVNTKNDLKPDLILVRSNWRNDSWKEVKR